MDLPAAADELSELGGGRCRHARKQVLVGVHCEARVGMAKAFGDDLDRHASGDK